MRVRVQHESDGRLVAVLGHDSATGWFGEVRREGRLLGSIDAMLDPTADLASLLRLLVEYGFCSAQDVAEATRPAARRRGRSCAGRWAWLWLLVHGQ